MLRTIIWTNQHPAYKLRLGQVLARVQLYENMAQVRRPFPQLHKKETHLASNILAEAKRPWELVKSPMAWDASTFDNWLRGLAVQLCYHDSERKAQLRLVLLEAVEHFLWSTVSSHQGSAGLDGHLTDLTVAHRRSKWLLKHQPRRIAYHDMMLQGVLFAHVDTYKEPYLVPACEKFLDTLRHRLWEWPQVGLETLEDWKPHIHSSVFLAAWSRPQSLESAWQHPK